VLFRSSPVSTMIPVILLTLLPYTQIVRCQSLISSQDKPVKISREMVDAIAPPTHPLDAKAKE